MALGMSIDPNLTSQLLGNKYTQPGFFAPQNTWHGNQLQVGGASSGGGGGGGLFGAMQQGVRPQGLSGVLAQMMMGHGQGGMPQQPQGAPPQIAPPPQGMPQMPQQPTTSPLMGGGPPMMPQQPPGDMPPQIAQLLKGGNPMNGMGMNGGGGLAAMLRGMNFQQ